MKVESYHDAMEAYKTPAIDWSHSYWRYAELINGRLAMIGIIILVLKQTLNLTFKYLIPLNSMRFFSVYEWTIKQGCYDRKNYENENWFI